MLYPTELRGLLAHSRYELGLSRAPTACHFATENHYSPTISGEMDRVGPSGDRGYALASSLVSLSSRHTRATATQKEERSGLFDCKGVRLRDSRALSPIDTTAECGADR